MHDIYCQVTDQNFLITKETNYAITLVSKKYHRYMLLKTKDAIKESQYSTKTNSPTVLQLNHDEDKNYLLTLYPTLTQPLKKFSSESIRAIVRNPNIDLQSIGINSNFDIQHHKPTQQIQKLLTKMDTIQRQSIDQNLRELAETAGFSHIYAQDYSGYFKDIKDYIYLNGENTDQKKNHR